MTQRKKVTEYVRRINYDRLGRLKISEGNVLN